MTAMVSGHGADTDGEETFVPAGVTVRYYTAENVDLDKDVGLFALLDKAGDPGRPISGGPITNYTLFSEDDSFIASWMAMGGDTSGAQVWWVGSDIPDETRLCEDPLRNSTDPDAVTCRSQGRHTCDGVLGLVKDTDIAILACRGSWDENAVPGGATATSYDAQVATVNEEVAEILEELESGDEARVADAEKRVDSLPQDKIAIMINNDFDYIHWQQARWLKEYALKNDLVQVMGQMASNEDDLEGIMEWLEKIPSYGQALDKLATSFQETFYQWYNTGSGPVQVALRERPAIDKVVAEQEEAESLQAASRMFEEGESS